MTWQAIARKDFRDGVRSKWLWVLSAVFVGLFVGAAYVLGTNLSEGTRQQITTNQFFQSAAGQLLVTLIVPLVAIVVSYGALVGERESGSVKLLLSLPHSRTDAVFGKFTGRSGLVTLPIMGGLLLSLVVLAVYGVGVDPLKFIAFTVLTMLLGAVFVSIAIGFSATASSSRRSMVGSVGLFFVLTMLWGQVRRILLVANNELSLGWSNVALMKYGLFVKYFNPVRAYQTLAARLYIDSPAGARLYEVGSLRRQAYVQQMGELPFFLSDWVVLAQFLLWLLLPVALGYLAFKDADL